jgi:class 3 adenylate cyclase/quercetin dioxygenase-like cupin family protein
VPRLQRKSFDQPDVVRTFKTGRIEVVHMDETAVGRFLFEPGWRWSRDVMPIAGTPSCAHRHVGYAISGTLHVAMDDGTELEIRAGDAFEIPPGHDAWVVGEDVWDTVEFTSSWTFGMAPEELGERILTTILFTDIVDSTRTAAELGDQRWRELLDGHDRAVRAALGRFDGREVKSTGDGFLGTFDGPARGILCAQAIQESCEPLGIRVRAGIHTGECEVMGDDIGGIAVHIAARVSSLAGPGEVLVSRTVKDLVAGSGTQFTDRGVHELKGVPDTWQLHAVAG